jgi:predicted enzyme related to lactoylglutathione lyase
MTHNPVNWFELYVQDMPRAKAFYEQVLDIELEALPLPDIEMQAFPMNPEAPGSGGSLICVPGVPSGGTGTMVYFKCEDCAVEEARVADAGGTVERPKMSIGEYGFVSVFKDPDGNLVGLHSLQ